VDLTFVEGIGVVVSAVIIFCGSVWLLLTMVMGPRLAYFISASVTLAFLLIMGVVWSVNPLGPIGKAPEWDSVAIGEDASQLDFGPASEYPDGAWEVPNPDDATQLAQAAELSSEAIGYLEQAINAQKVTTFENAEDAQANSESVRFFMDGEAQYGAVTLEALEQRAAGEVVAVLVYDPGSPLGPPRLIAAGTFVLFLGHLFGLSRSEKRARRRNEAQAGTR